jgi:hypothetical protein
VTEPLSEAQENAIKAAVWRTVAPWTAIVTTVAGVFGFLLSWSLQLGSGQSGINTVVELLGTVQQNLESTIQLEGKVQILIAELERVSGENEKNLALTREAVEKSYSSLQRISDKEILADQLTEVSNINAIVTDYLGRAKPWEVTIKEQFKITSL